LLVKEEKPWTVSLTQDNAGAAKLGALQRGIGLSHGNLFGLDQQGSMQYTCSYASASCSLGLNWSMPVPFSRLDKFTVSAFHAQQQPISSSGIVSYVGYSSQLSLKYVNVHPIQAKDGMTSSLEWSVGVDSKSTNNNFEFAGIYSVWNFASVPATVLQFPVTLDLIQTDENGQTRINEQWVHSPGGLISHNDSNTFNNYVDQASARYTYWRQELSRTLKLFNNWQLSSKLQTQLANQNLLYSERLVLGGPASLRSYTTASATGSNGLVVSQELRSPRFNIWQGGAVQDISQWGLFWDAARVQQVLPILGDLQVVSLSGAGLLFESSFDRRLKMAASAGRQFRALPGTPPALGTTLNFSLSAIF
jgi:hemolysin activation/secretion protein